MEYSIFTSVDYMLEAYDITIEDIKKLLNDEEHKYLHFIR